MRAPAVCHAGRRVGPGHCSWAAPSPRRCGGARAVVAPPTMSGGDPHRMAPASATSEAGSAHGDASAAWSVESLRSALASAQEAATTARQAADAAQHAAAAAEAAAARTSRMLALALAAQPSERGEVLPPPRGAPPQPSSTGPVYGRDTRVLPRRIILVRHGESQGNLDENMYCRVPDPEIALTERGHQQAAEAGQRIRDLVEADQAPGSYQLFVYTSPYRRTKQTCADILAQFPREAVLGVREEPQLREQDFGNFQDAQAKQREKAERNAYGRFFYRFPNGESGSDVYDRLTVFEDHLVRDIDAGRFPESCNLVVVTHGLSLRIFLARWLHWTVAEYESVYNPPNCAPVVLERTAAAGGNEEECVVDGAATACDPSGRHHTKNLYTLSRQSMALLGAERMMELKSMLVPERAWERTLSGIFNDFECELNTPAEPSSAGN